MLMLWQKLNQFENSKILDGIEQYAKDPIKTKIKKLKTPLLRRELILISKIAHRKQVYLKKTYIR